MSLCLDAYQMLDVLMLVIPIAVVLVVLLALLWPRGDGHD